MKVKGKKTIDLYFSMSQREAEVLATLMEHVGGSPDGPRGVAADLSKALHELGITAKVLGTGSITLPQTWERYNSLKDNFLPKT